jgi:cyclopropane fatty-acyl-phospholipid synthase-like methyltransferase
VGPQVDIVAAFNFSYFIFKTRSIMKTYFTQAKKSLKPKGLFILDAFGGTDSQKANIEKTKRRGFIYYWDQKSFDPVTYHAKFQIHFKLNNETKKRENIFSYDWRLWTLPELRDLLEEVGFKKVYTYWEGTTKKGKGDGKFKRVTHGEECEGWIAYLVAEN